MKLDTFAYFVNSLSNGLNDKPQFCFLCTIPTACYGFDYAPLKVERFMPRPPYTDVLREMITNQNQVTISFRDGVFKISVAAPMVLPKSHDSTDVIIYSSGNGVHAQWARMLRLNGDRWEATFEDANGLVGEDLLIIIS